MEDILSTYDWPDAVAVSLTCLFPIAIVYLIIIFPRLFFLNLRDFGKFRSYLSLTFIFFFGLMGTFATQTYFELRDLGELPSFSLIVSIVDFSLGFLLVSFVALVPAIYVFSIIPQRFPSISESFDYGSSMKSKVGAGFWFVLLILPGFFVSDFILNKSTWLTNFITGSPMIITEINPIEKIAIVSHSYPLRISAIFTRFFANFGIEQYSVFAIVAGIGVIIEIIANTLSILHHSNKDIQVEKQLDASKLPPIDNYYRQQMDYVQNEHELYYHHEDVVDEDLEKRKLPPTMTDEEFERFIRGGTEN